MRIVDSAFGTRSFVRKGKQRTEILFTGVRVSVLEGPDTGRSASCTDHPLKIGTAESNDLVLTDRAVSREHLLVQLGADGIQVEDLSSKNGTWIGEKRITVAVIGDSTVAELGETRIRIERLTTPLEVASSRARQFHGLVSQSDAMRKVFGLISSLASRDHPVMILGESGTGKELVARALHLGGARAKAPLMVLNGAAVTAELLPSELFGHERGAFTGAVDRRAGIFEAAAGGTVVLDELGEIPLAVQAMLLRVLETREVTRLGSHKAIPVNFRLVCSTHRDIKQMVKEEKFRADLYFRLAAVIIRIPPLRDRPEDIPLLTKHYLEIFAAEQEAPVRSLSAGALKLLGAHRWPGNVRELRNLLWNLSIAHGEPVIQPDELQPVLEELKLDAPVSAPAGADQELEALLRANGWNIRETAKELGITRNTLYYRMARAGLRRPERS